MRRFSFALLVASAMLFGCAGSGTGPYQRTLDLAGIAGVYGGTYTRTLDGGNDTGSADFTFSSDGAVHGTVVSSENEHSVQIIGTVTTSGAFTGQATDSSEQQLTLTGTVAQNGANRLLVNVGVSDGATVVLDLTRVQATQP